MGVIKKSMLKMDGRILDTAKKSVKYAREVYEELDDDQEHGLALYLNGNLELIKHKVVSSGHQDSTAFDPKIIFRHALLCGSNRIVLFHNHNIVSAPRPSQDDKDCTVVLVEGGKLLNIEITDHIILSRGGWYSFRNNGKIE